MPTWGAATWMTAPPTYDPIAPGVNPPFFMLLYPQNGAINVDENSIIRVAYFDADADALPTGLSIYVNGNIVYDGATATFTTGWAGRVTTFAGRVFAEFAPLRPFSYGSVLRVSAAEVDLALNSATTEFSFTVRADPLCYTGAEPLTPETWILRPMTRFLDLEPLRMLLVQHVLDDAAFQIGNRDQVAARALYQLAYDTEISAVLNPYMRPDTRALATTVCQKRSTLELAGLLESYQNRLAAGLDALIVHGALPREYRANLADYQDSLLYTYRVAVAVVAVFLARAVEENVA